jgi:hypothetical protein
MVGVEEISLAELRRRTSAKWRTYPPDVLPLPVAEMDFPPAGPVAEALHAAIRRSDLGYADPSSGLPEALAGFAARRWGWQVDPAQVTLAPEVGWPSSRSSACWPDRAIGWWSIHRSTTRSSPGWPRPAAGW